MPINIPENHRENFDRSASFAIEMGEVTPSSLAEHLGTSTLVSSIMIGYMEKAGLVTKGKNDEPRHARITPAEWEAIGRSIENYTPAPEDVAEEEEKEETTPEEIVKEELYFLGKARFTFLGEVAGFFNNGEKGNFNLAELETIRLKKPRLFFKGTLTLIFQDSVERVRFKRSERATAELIFGRVAKR